MISRLEYLCRKDESEAWETEYEGKFTDVRRQDSASHWGFWAAEMTTS